MRPFMSKKFSTHKEVFKQAQTSLLSREKVGSNVLINMQTNLILEWTGDEGWPWFASFHQKDEVNIFKHIWQTYPFTNKKNYARK